MLKVNVVFVLANVVFVLANVVFAKLAIRWVGGWVGGGGWGVLAEHKEWLGRAIQYLILMAP